MSNVPWILPLQRQSRAGTGVRRFRYCQWRLLLGFAVVALALAAFSMYVWHGGFARQTAPLHLFSAASTATMPLLECGRGNPVMQVFTTIRPFSAEELSELTTAPLPHLHERLLPTVSWLALSPGVTVVWLGDHPSYHVARLLLPPDVQGRVVVEPFVDTNFLSIPLFHSMWRRAEASRADIVAITNGDIYAQASLMPAIHRFRCSSEPFMLIAARMDLAASEPLLQASVTDRSAAMAAQLQAAVAAAATLHDFGGVDLWLWDNRRSISPPLLGTVIPPFAFGRSRYDNWITHELIAVGGRHVVDITHVAQLVHVEHTRGGQTGSATVPNYWNANRASDWSVYANNVLALSTGTYVGRLGTSNHAPEVLLPCLDIPMNRLCLLARTRPGICPCGSSVWSQQAQSDTQKMTGSPATLKDFPIHVSSIINGSHSLTGLLDVLLPDRLRGGERRIVLLAATADYADTVMNWVCAYRRMSAARGTGVVYPFIIAALDDVMFDFGFTAGLPIFLASALPFQRESAVREGGTAAGCAYNSPCFRRLTKHKSRLVLQVLQLGVDVLFTDADIAWFSHPFDDPTSFEGFSAPDTMFVQSNEPDTSQPLNGIRRINSGFYFIPSSPVTINALTAVVSHAAASVLSEQPSFYDVLCGVHGQLREGDAACVSHGMTTRFLSLQTYPNGASYDHWRSLSAGMNAALSCADKGFECRILHANWLSGLEAKTTRMKEHGLWYYQDDGTCRYDWAVAIEGSR